MPDGRPRPARARGASVGGADYLANISNQLNAMSANISVLEQKLTHVGRNETVLNRNLISLNNKVKDLEAKVAAGGNGGGVSAEVTTALQDSIASLRTEVESLKLQVSSGNGGLPQGVTAEEFKRLKYLIETIDPLKFVTIDQVSQLIDEKLGK